MCTTPACTSTNSQYDQEDILYENEEMIILNPKTIWLQL